MECKFKYEIGQILQDNKRDITIIERKYIKGKGKFYKYLCNKCEFDCSEHYSVRDKIYKDEMWIKENTLFNGIGCSCCNGNHIVVKGINDIPTTHPYLVKYFKNIEEIYMHSSSSNRKVIIKCPNCGYEKEMMMRNFFKRGFSCPQCMDSISYPEKFMVSVLNQLKIDFRTQLNKTTYKWCKNYKYDFYFEWRNEKYILEVNGSQHYQESNRGRSLKEEQENDKLKKELALHNDIKEENYIVIDCRKSELMWIKNNDNGILNSKLNKLFDLTKINWEECHKYASSNLVKIACDYKKNNKDMTTAQIGELMNYNAVTIRRWLKQGNGIWCEYNSKEESNRVRNKSSIKNMKRLSKPVCILKNKTCFGVFNSTADCARKSEELLGVKMNHSHIGMVCNNQQKHHKGYIFKYIDNLTPEEYIKYDIENKLKELHNNNYTYDIQNNKKFLFCKEKYICITTNKTFETVKEAGEYYNCNPSTIISCCKQKLKSSGKLSDGTKLVWMYYDEYIKQNQLIHNESLGQAI